MKIIILCVALASFVIRVQVCRELAGNDPQVSNPSEYTDMWTYRSLSERIVKGEFEDEYYYQPFYYAVFLPTLKYLFGFGVWPVILAQCLLSAVTVWLAGATAARLWKGIAGIAAALLTALSSTLILYTAFHLIATLQAFWIVLLAYFCVKALEPRACRAKSFARRSTEWAGIGCVSAMAILTRGNIWFFVPGILLAVTAAEFALIPEISDTDRMRKRFKAFLPAALFLFMAIAPQIPFAWRNTAIKGSFTGSSTAAGAVLCLGDTPESPPGGREAGSGPGPMEYPDTCKAWSAGGGTASVASRITRWAFREPLAFLELQLRKCLLFWDYREIPNNVALEMDGLRSPTLSTLGLLPLLDVRTPMGPRKIIFMNLVPIPALLLLFGLAGAIFAFGRMSLKLIRKRRARLTEALLLYFVIAYWLGTAAFYILARFRAPVTPLLAIFAGGFIFHSYKLLSRRDHKMGSKAALTAVFALLFSGAVVFSGYNVYRTHCEPTIMRLARPNGVASRLNDTTLLLKDNGPATFGGWTPERMKDGMTIKKRFVIPRDSHKNSKVVLRITIVWN
ncbi:MAG: glycosyltransferase family 39 protein, partial [Victivallales bacterium]|nr:glycosyltransferase family 39 protein [Victivallales bacterium]